MKKEITTLLMALCLVGTTVAQQNRSRMNVANEGELLSTTTQGDYTVNRYLVKEKSSDNDEFSVRYKINLTRLVSTYDNNSEELKGLDAFLREIQQDTLKKIASVNIMGYASPDGPLNLNEDLAMERAQDFRSYLNKKYDMSKYGGATKADVYKWNATSEAVSKSSMPNKESVLGIVNGDMTASAKEAKLKTMPQAWGYMIKNILPPMRCVELCVKYNSWKIVETRTRNKNCETKVTENITTNYFIIIDDDPEGMIINPSTAPLDFNDDKCKGKFKMNSRREKIKEMERLGQLRYYLFEKSRY